MQNEYYKTLRIIIICAAVLFGISLGIQFFTQNKGEIERTPAYIVKRVDVKPEYEEYKIEDESENVIAIVKMYLEDFEHDFKQSG